MGLRCYEALCYTCTPELYLVLLLINPCVYMYGYVSNIHVYGVQIIPSAGKYLQGVAVSYHHYISCTSLAPLVLAETYVKHE